MRVILAVLLLSVSGMALPAQEGMMAPPAEAGEGGSMMMSGSASRIIPFTDLSTARLLAAQGPTGWATCWCSWWITIRPAN